MKLLKIVVFAAVATAQLAGGQAPVAGVVDEEAERGKYSGAKDPFVCGSVKATGKGPLKFNCKMGKKGQTCKVKCNKAPKNIHTPKKMSCVKNQWSDKKGKTQFDINDFGCLDKEPKNPYGDNGKTTTKPYKTTTKPYKTTTKPKTTKKPYKTTTKPYKTTQKPKTTKYPSGKKPDQYKPVIGCPWEKKGSVVGDCGEKFKGRCNLKYFKVTFIVITCFNNSSRRSVGKVSSTAFMMTFADGKMLFNSSPWSLTSLFLLAISLKKPTMSR